MNPVAFRLGAIEVRWYGLLIVTGILVAAYVATREAKRRGQDPENIWNGLIFCLIGGIIGARLYHVFSTPSDGSLGWWYYRQNPLAILKIWEGGLGIYGAVIGGIIGLWIFTKVSKLPFFVWADCCTPGLLLAQAIGRWGNFANQELYGPPTDLPWGIYIPLEKRLPGLEAYERFHPVFLYESLFCLLGFVLFMIFARKWASKLRAGDVFFAYFIYYPLGRFFIEMLRPDAWKMGSLAAAQVFALIAIAIGILGFVVNHVRKQPAPAVSAPGDNGEVTQ